MSGDAVHTMTYRDGAGDVVSFEMDQSYVDSTPQSALPQRQPRSGP